MEANTMKTLAQYIAKLHKTDQSLEHPEEYVQDELDTNGVEQDHVETFWPPANDKYTACRSFGRMCLNTRSTQKLQGVGPVAP